MGLILRLGGVYETRGDSEAFTGYVNGLYAQEAAGQGWEADISILKINEVNNWLKAWMFMERCGFKAGEAYDDDADDESENDTEPRYDTN